MTAARWRGLRAGWGALLLLGPAAAAQAIAVYSEFSRIDPFGRVVQADRAARAPREILSPAVPRGAVSSFHVVAEGRPGSAYTIQVAQNPDNAVRVAAYRERYSKVGGEWLPDGLEPVPLPYEGRLANAGIPDQTAQAFWVDLWVDRNARAERVKVEPQLFIDGGWIRYPMEVRVSAVVLGGSAAAARAAGLADVGRPSADSALLVWVASQCNPTETNQPAEPLSIRNLIARNARQDVRFAGGSAPPELLRALGFSDRAALCRAREFRFAAPEDYLAIRDSVAGARE